MSSRTIHRRQFLGRSAAGLAAMGAGRLFAAPALAERGALDRIAVALIGCGRMGNQHLGHFLKAPGVEVAALCDVDEGRLRSTAERVKGERRGGPELCEDFRRVLDRRDIKAVVVATPDHWHAIPSILACQAGKDVYVEAPVAHNILEGKALAAAARKHGRVVQVGTQERSRAHFRKAVELVRSGVLGKITCCRTWSVENVFPGFRRAADAEHPPAGVNYDLWLGPAPARKFNRNRFHGSFRHYFDYASGMIGDSNVHLQDIVHWAMDRDAPATVAASGGKYALEDDRDTPDTQEVLYFYAAKGDLPPFVSCSTLSRASGRGVDGKGQGILFQGTRGSLFVDRKGWEIQPERKQAFAELKGGGSDPYGPHLQDFLACVKSRLRPVSDIETAHRAASACHLGNIALRLGRKLHWDGEREIAVDAAGSPDREANALLGREYRAPWTLPAV